MGGQTRFRLDIDAHPHLDPPALAPLSRHPRKKIAGRKHLFKINVLLILIRFSKDLHFLSNRQYEFAALQINDISNMLGGWLKYEEHKLRVFN